MDDYKPIISRFGEDQSENWHIVDSVDYHEHINKLVLTDETLLEQEVNVAISMKTKPVVKKVLVFILPFIKLNYVSLTEDVCCF